MPFKKNLKDSGYTYSGAWYYPIVSAIPKQEWIAEAGGRLDNGNFLEVLTGKTDAIELSNHPGEYIFPVYHEGDPFPDGDSTASIRWRSYKKMSHFWEELIVHQPDNYYHRYHRAFYLPLESASSWEVGDAVTSQTGASGTIYWLPSSPLASGAPDDRKEVVLDVEFDGGINDWRNQTITNITKGDSAYSDRAIAFGANNKTSICWVNTDPADYYAGGYSDGAYNMEVDTDNGQAGNSFIKFQLSAGAGQPNTGTYDNQLSGAPRYPIVWDTADNGTSVGLVLERRRATSEGAEDGEFRLWKKTWRVGGDYPEWQLIYEVTGLPGWTNLGDNKFLYCYIFGPANSGFLENTRFGVKEYRIWETKPDFLP